VKPLPWLVACEFSQMVTQALRRKGVEAYSCDLRPTEGNPDWHIHGDAVEASRSRKWAGMIAHPECTHMTLAGARWFYDPRFPDKPRQRDEAIAFWHQLRAAPIDKQCFENPQPLQYVMDRIGRYTQKVQPWQFGDNETKGVCLWLYNLPPLVTTVKTKPENIEARVWRMAPGPDRQKERSRFFPGISNAMAEWATI
jgi:hypothetical protein